MWYFYSSSFSFPRSKYCSQLRICALLRYGLCWQGSADTIFMTFTPLQCIRFACRISLSLISIAIQMLTFKATSYTGLGAGLQISEGMECTAEVEEVDDGEARRSAYVLHRLGNPANLSLTSTSSTFSLPPPFLAPSPPPPE